MGILRYFVDPIVWKVYWAYVRGREERERELLQRLTAKYPDEYLFHNYLAFNCARAKIYRDAIESMKRVGELNEHPIQLYFLGSWYFELHDGARSIELFRRFLDESEEESESLQGYINKAEDFLRRNAESDSDGTILG